MKKLISIILVLVMTALIIPFNTSAAADETTLVYKGETYKLVNDDLFNNIYRRATPYIVAAKTSNGIYALGEDLSAVLIQEVDGVLTAPDGTGVLSCVEEDGFTTIDCSLYTKIGDKYLKGDLSTLALADTAQEAGTRCYTVWSGGKVGYRLIIESETNAWNTYHYLTFEDRNGPSFATDSIFSEIYIYQKVCDHAGAEHHDEVDPTCTAGGNSEYSYCPVCESFLDASGSRSYVDPYGYTVTYTADSFAIKPTGHRYEGGVCTRCGEAAIVYTQVTSDDMIVADPAYRYILVNENGEVLAVDLSKEYDNEAMALTALAPTEGGYYIDDSQSPASVAAAEFTFGTYEPEYPELPMPDDGTPLYTLLSDVGYGVIAMGEFRLFYVPANGGSYKYPLSVKSLTDGHTDVRSWDYGSFGDPVAFGAEPYPPDPNNPQMTFILDSVSNVYLYRGELAAAPHVHKFGSYTITTQPTRTASGVRTEYCAECGQVMATREVVYMVGDVNGDSLTTIKDLGDIKAFLAGGDENGYATVNCDVNGDELLTISDIAEMKKNLA